LRRVEKYRKSTVREMKANTNNYDIYFFLDFFLSFSSELPSSYSSLLVVFLSSFTFENLPFSINSLKSSDFQTFFIILLSSSFAIFTSMPVTGSWSSFSPASSYDHKIIVATSSLKFSTYGHPLILSHLWKSMNFLMTFK